MESFYIFSWYTVSNNSYVINHSEDVTESVSVRAGLKVVRFYRNKTVQFALQTHQSLLSL
ncbi:MAG: hypothetical protein A2161_12665 [Candidatus Schekmanbacteria bacterium RBG_13_48_7]|uniref:Uncharacterized protein n=1 Tax=Candidatus Schekmanbacteria bacterium RBG_13_48_7 TaxID=1817878 RepID=A0A1F7S2R4_9BACT|nr:MAG: hypothetical protein A2161_12665 [Candidatus Schekmanbacteria bacterium RBG_13_48_7]